MALEQIESYAGTAARLVQDNSAFILNVLAIIVGIFSGILLSRWGLAGFRERNRVKQIGQLTRQIKDKERVFNTPNLHATLMDRQSVIFSFFTLVSAMMAYLREIDSFNDDRLLGTPLLDYFTWVAFATGAIAMAVLLNKWVWSNVFVNYDQWIRTRRDRIDVLQKKGLSRRASLETTETELVEIENSEPAALADRNDRLVEKETGRPSGDQFGPFLRSRVNMRFVLSKSIDDEMGDRPWRMGIVKNGGAGGFGFIAERIVLPGSGNMSQIGPEYYFSYSNVCNTELPELGDEVFFISSIKGSKAHKHPPAYLVCLRGKTCRGLVRQLWSRVKCFVEIVDGSENYTSVFAQAENIGTDTAIKFEVGQSVEGIVSHNHRGVILRDLKRV
ncbi:MAG: hypothetical protein VR74_11980 [Hyphomonas sp. BRH_c22]|uniref:hypothetical protein n=1 Tax=Hyphomonas sp. BRH_c22 TaxID=1629710 RepID=UPI0005F1BAA7|nr:hypothetical protein [Hyphomonas sp. BRH_c22]KJS36560.1 MAG: hypothetical protein VR74_11980 [Hyphomonas sp. BRH_c22]